MDGAVGFGGSPICSSRSPTPEWVKPLRTCPEWGIDLDDEGVRMSIERCDVRFIAVTESRDATRWRHSCRSQRWPPERMGEHCHRFVELGLPRWTHPYPSRNLAETLDRDHHSGVWAGSPPNRRE